MFYLNLGMLFVTEMVFNNMEILQFEVLVRIPYVLYILSRQIFRIFFSAL